MSSTASVSSAASAAGLQKRPTFEALDKRKSWTNAAEQQAREQAGVRAVAAASEAMEAMTLASNIAAQASAASTTHENNGSVSGRSSSRISAYQNTQILNNKPGPGSTAAELFISNSNVNSATAAILAASSHSFDPRRKKPVPLPRSKIPVLLPGVEARPQKHAGNRFIGLGPRSKVSYETLKNMLNSFLKVCSAILLIRLRFQDMYAHTLIMFYKQYCKKSD